MPVHDVVIVGGGPAGLSTALFLAAACPEVAARSVLLERSRYPRDKYCAGGVGARADKILEKVGVRVEVPSVPLDAVAASYAAGRTVARREGMGRVVRRMQFDARLAEHVRLSGVPLLSGVTVRSIARDGSLFAVDTSAGTLRARVVVGADGVGSMVRRSLGFKRGEIHAQALEVDTPSVERDLPRDTLHFDLRDATLDGYLWDFPTVVDGQALVCRGIYYLRIGSRGRFADVRQCLRRHLASHGLDLDRCTQKRFAERGLAWAEPMAGPGVLLVGEAAGIDGLTGEGIAQGVQYGELAGLFLAERLARGRTDLAGWRAFVHGERLGRDLRVRAWVMRLFYGPHRSAIEPFLADAEHFYQLGLQVFAGAEVERDTIRRTFEEIARYVRHTGWSSLTGWRERRRRWEASLEDGSATKGS